MSELLNQDKHSSGSTPLWPLPWTSIERPLLIFHFKSPAFFVFKAVVVFNSPPPKPPQ